MDEATRDAIHFYTRPGCPFSASLARRLRRRGFPLEYHDIWEDPTAAAFVRSVARGNETVPTLRIGDTHLVNPSIRAVVSAAEAHAPHLVPGPEVATGRRLRARLRRIGRRDVPSGE